MHRQLALAGALFAVFVAASEVKAQARVEVGILSCAARASAGAILTSSKYLRCRFQRPGRDEFYRGRIARFGIDLGSTGNTAMAWAVFAPTANPPPRSLTGEYGGIGVEATAGYGIGANALIGGSQRGIILQPLSVQAQTGLNVAAGVQSLVLRAD
jgi:Protein of unknown function (DUF992)